jgi:transposase-like protein
MLDEKKDQTGGREGERAVGERNEAGTGRDGAGAPDPELKERPERRRFSAKYKLRILEAADACTKPGELGALLRREGLYTSHLSQWRKQRREGALAALSLDGLWVHLNDGGEITVSSAAGCIGLRAPGVLHQ